MASVRKDIRGLDAEVKEKEREWNLLIREKRKMEMCYTKLKSKTLGAAVEEKQAAKNQQLQLVSPQQQQSQPSSRIVATEVMITWKIFCSFPLQHILVQYNPICLTSPNLNWTYITVPYQANKMGLDITNDFKH